MNVVCATHEGSSASWGEELVVAVADANCVIVTLCPWFIDTVVRIVMLEEKLAVDGVAVVAGSRYEWLYGTLGVA